MLRMSLCQCVDVEGIPGLPSTSDQKQVDDSLVLLQSSKANSTSLEEGQDGIEADIKHIRDNRRDALSSPCNRVTVVEKEVAPITEGFVTLSNRIMSRFDTW